MCDRQSENMYENESRKASEIQTRVQPSPLPWKANRRKESDGKKERKKDRTKERDAPSCDAAPCLPDVISRRFSLDYATGLCDAVACVCVCVSVVVLSSQSSAGARMFKHCVCSVTHGLLRQIEQIELTHGLFLLPPQLNPEGIFKTLMKRVRFVIFGARFLPDQYHCILANPTSNKSNASIALTLLQKAELFIWKT